MNDPKANVRLLLLNDLHFQTGNNPGYPESGSRAEWLLSQVEPGGSLAGVDALLSLGDLIHGETLETIEIELSHLQERLKRITKPFYPCCGNHEIKQAEGDPQMEAPYRAFAGSRGMDYRFPLGPVDCVVLNNAGTFHLTTQRRKERAERLEAMLQAEPDRPKILVCHIPLVPLREPDTLRPSFYWRSYQCLESEILDIVDRFEDRIPLVLSGHLHLTGKVVRRSVTHFTCAGTASFPHHYTLLTIEKDQIHIEVRTLPAELHRPETNIHAPPFHSRDFTDLNHPTPLSYVEGLPEERQFSCPLD